VNWQRRWLDAAHCEAVERCARGGEVTGCEQGVADEGVFIRVSEDPATSVGAQVHLRILFPGVRPILALVWSDSAISKLKAKEF
jgi:hypothetical protein